MFLARTHVNAALLALGVLTAQREQIAFSETGFTTYHEPTDVVKWYTTPRYAYETPLDLIVCHVTAVRGGFGIATSALNRWRSAVELGDIPLSWVAELAKCERAGVDLTAHRCALWERYRRTPYHQIGATNGDSIANQSLDLVTFHGNGGARGRMLFGGNAGVGWALDCHPDQELDDWLIETGRASLRMLIARVWQHSTYAREHGIRLAPHRAFSASRRRDTDFRVHREVVLPVVKSNPMGLPGAVRIDYEVHMNGGLPVSTAMDDNALYDAKGRRLR